jgi:hypothetical protein
MTCSVWLPRADPEAPSGEEGEEHVGGRVAAALRWREDIHHVGPDRRRHRQAHLCLTQSSGPTNSSPYMLSSLLQDSGSDLFWNWIRI